MRVLYLNALGEEINCSVLAEFTFREIQMLVVKDRIGSPVMIRRDTVLEFFHD